MFPLNAIPVSGNTKFQTFYASGTDWQAWQKPAGCSMVYIFMLAAGGGGGRSNNGAVTVGGGGGGSGGASRMLIPAILLPDTIWVQPGAGGLGATSFGAAGTSGSISYVCVQPNTTQANIIFTQNGGTGGAAATTGGAAGGVGVNTGGPFGSLGLWYTIAGQAGAVGAAAANTDGGSLNIFSSGLITGAGTGGGNGTRLGGILAGAGGFFPQNIASNNATKNGGDGAQKGLPILFGLKTMPLLFTGGTGGNGASSGAAGKGGDAAYGGGGGGGGGNTNAAGTSGNGGNGGDGFIIIGTF